MINQYAALIPWLISIGGIALVSGLVLLIRVRGRELRVVGIILLCVAFLLGLGAVEAHLAGTHHRDTPAHVFHHPPHWRMGNTH